MIDLITYEENRVLQTLGCAGRGHGRGGAELKTVRLLHHRLWHPQREIPDAGHGSPSRNGDARDGRQARPR